MLALNHFLIFMSIGVTACFLIGYLYAPIGEGKSYGVRFVIFYLLTIVPLVLVKGYLAEVRFHERWSDLNMSLHEHKISIKRVGKVINVEDIKTSDPIRWYKGRADLIGNCAEVYAYRVSLIGEYFIYCFNSSGDLLIVEHAQNYAL